MEIIGIDEEKIRAISKRKKENDWALNYRLQSFKNFQEIGMPKFGPHVDLDFRRLFIINQMMLMRPFKVTGIVY